MTNLMARFNFPKDIHVKYPGNNSVVGNGFCVSGVQCGYRDDPGLPGEPGIGVESAEKFSKKIQIQANKIKRNMLYGDKLSCCKLKCGVVDWKSMGFMEGLSKEKEILFIKNAQAIYDYIENNDVVRYVGSVDMMVSIYPIIRKIVSESDCELEDAEKFYNYCVEYLRQSAPHYKNIKDKLNLEADATSDLANHIVNILKNDDGKD